MARRPSFLRSYAFSLVLLGAIVVGSVLGCLFQEHAAAFKPFGDVFLNALFVMVVPLVFFSISSAVAGMVSTTRLVQVMSWMLIVFVATGIIASVLMVVAVQLYPPAKDVQVKITPKAPEQVDTGRQIVDALTVPDFVGLLSKKNMLALIIFSILVGLAASGAGEKGRAFTAFLQSANDVFMKLVGYVMYYAPIGLGAYFAYIVGHLGPQLLGGYARAMALYYPLCLGYFFVAFTLYAYVGGGRLGVRTFWSNIAPASLTAAATGSSYATIPVNLEAADRIGVPRDISEVVIPIGATIHMDGSALAAVLKIAFLFNLYHMDFSGPGTMLTAVGVAILTGTVVSGIPAGGVVGEILIVTVYGFQPAGEALAIINLIGQLVDPAATMVNAIGDNVASMIVARVLGGKEWMKKAQGSTSSA
jgi:Na+/H+-dicarboxylate symporter